MHDLEPMTMTTITNQRELRSAFWAQHPHLDEQARAAGIRSKRQNDQSAFTRCTWVDWIDHMCRSGQISEALASRATL
jgi:hypothetical protein